MKSARGRKVVKQARIVGFAASIFWVGSPVMASNLIDFESYSVGDVVPQYAYAYAGQFSPLFFPGTIVEIDGNKALKLNDGVGPHHRRTTEVGGSHHIPIIDPYFGSTIGEEKIVGTVDVLAPTNGQVLENGAPQYFVPGVWTTVNFHGGYGGVAYTFAGLGDFYIDNIVYESVIEPVPEPAAWALMILGFGGVGAALRTRRLRAEAL